MSNQHKKKHVNKNELDLENRYNDKKRKNKI